MMKKVQQTIDICEIKVVGDNNEEIDTETLRLIDFVNLSLKINDQTYHTIVNPIWIESFQLPKMFMVKCPAVPTVKIINGSYENVSVKWFISKQKDGKDWDLVKDEFVYTPEESHVDHFIKVEICTSLNLKRQTFTITSKDKIKPCPQSDYQLALFFDRIRLESGTVRICTYNILSENYADRKSSHDTLYRHCSAAFLAQSYRQCLILKKLCSFDSDVILLQEVDTALYNDIITPVLKTLNLGGIHQMKTGRVSEGGAILWSNETFTFVKNISIDNLSARLSEDFSEICCKMKSFIMKDDRLWQRWQSLSHCMTGCILRLRQRSVETYLIIVNVHLFYHPQYELLRLYQMSLVLSEVETMKKDYPNAAIILGGDFNASYEDQTIQLVLDNTICYETAAGTITLQHNLGHLESAFKDKVQFTNFTLDYVGILDHIFFNSSHIKVNKVYDLPSKSDIESNIALPNKYHPSDHLPLMVDFVFI